MSEFYIADCTGLLQGDWLCAKCKRTEKKLRPTSGMKTKVVAAAPASADGRGVQALSRYHMKTLYSSEVLVVYVGNSHTAWSCWDLGYRFFLSLELFDMKVPDFSFYMLWGRRDRELLRTPTNMSRESSGPNFNKALFLPGGLPDDIELGYYVKGQVSGNPSVTLLCRSMCSYQALGYCK
jgi:hypothetical protein